MNIYILLDLRLSLSLTLAFGLFIVLTINR